tara:strand:- start:24 stop:293 length:270 start_codon:yes stop_codon:yes gene_type:complete
MGRYSGHIKKMPRGGNFGEIYAKGLDGTIAFFDIAEGKRATGPGNLQSRSRVTFEMDGRGRAVKIYKSKLVAERRGQHKKYQRSKKWGY